MNEESSKLLDKLKKKDLKKNGKKGAYLSRIDYLVEKYKTALFFLFVQMLTILLLIFGYLNIKAKTTVEVRLPKVVKDTDYGVLKIGLNESNSLYYRIMGNYFTESMFNANADNIEERTIEFKKILYPEIYEQYGKNIDEFKNFVVNNKASLSYNELKSDVKINEDKSALFTTKGVLDIKIGSFGKKQQLCTTKVKMITENYMLFILGFSKTCTNVSETKKGKDNEK